jgi:hypothetical protein
MMKLKRTISDNGDEGGHAKGVGKNCRGSVGTTRLIQLTRGYLRLSIKTQ